MRRSDPMKKKVSPTNLGRPREGGRVAVEGFSHEDTDSLHSPANPIVGLYIRVSTDRQAKEGDSLEEQESELKKFCEYRNFCIYRCYIERGKSGGNTNRPEYQRLMADIAAGKLNAVVVKKLDRLSRSLMDFEALMVLLQTHEVDFISLREQFDTTTAMGKAMLRVALVFAQLEREQTSERIKDVFAWRAEQGLYNGGTRPFGYDSLSAELIPHKQEKKVVVFIFDTFLESQSTARTALLCNTAGFRMRNGQLWDKRQIHKILIRPIYKGQVQWNGQCFPGVHQPLVSDTKFEAVQAIFEARQTLAVRSKIKGFLNGVLYCPNCDAPWVPNYTKKKTGKKYYYYRCRSTLNTDKSICRGQYLPFEAAHTGVLESLLACCEDPFFRETGQRIASYNAKVDKRILTLSTERDALAAKKDTLKQKRTSYIDTLISGQFSRDERTHISAQIEEFQLEEKQMEAAFWCLDFEITHTEEQRIDLHGFKEQMLNFLINHPQFSPKEWQQWFGKHIQKITYRNGAFSVSFKALSRLAVPPQNPP
jgi:site-specific DNA recombinase